MAWKNTDVSMKPVMFDDLDEIFDEKGTQFCALRRVQWVKEGEEPDREKSHLELRRWRIDSNGQENAAKGLVFLSDNGPNELAHVLVKKGFGETKTLITELKDRADFKDSVEHLYDKDIIDNDGEFFDMRTALLSNDPDPESDDEED